jgi:hypothetical protein
MKHWPQDTVALTLSPLAVLESDRGPVVVIDCAGLPVAPLHCHGSFQSEQDVTTHLINSSGLVKRIDPEIAGCLGTHPRESSEAIERERTEVDLRITRRE